MPIVDLGRIGWYPVELLLQSFAIMKGANDDAQKQAVLKYHDDYSGEKKIEKLKRDIATVSGASPYGQTLENKFGFAYSKTPLNQKAKLLAEPSVVFGRNQRADPSNGSWNLAGGRELYR